MAETINKELYILPSFFSKIYESAPLNNIENLNNKYDVGNYDQYTEIKKYSNKSIVSKFKEIGSIPLSLSTIEYNDDCWDFSDYKLIGHGHSKLDFSRVPTVFKDDLKDYILLTLLSGNIKLSTLRTYFLGTRAFLNNIYLQGITEIKNIDTKHVQTFLNSVNKKASRTYIGYQNAVKKILTYYDAEHGTSICTESIIKLCEPGYNLLQAEIKNKRRKPIPEDYFDKLVKTLIQIMDDDKLSDYERAKAAILIIDSQTGLRASELSLLQANSVESIQIGNTTCRMIHYRIIKTAKGNVGMTNHITYINDLSYKAYLTLMELFKENRKTRNSDLLFCPQNARLPYDSDRYRLMLRDICILNHDTIGSNNSYYKDILEANITVKRYCRDRFKGKDFRDTPLKKFNDINDDTEFFFPVLHQFRNTVVDRLLRAGVNLEFVRRYMGHLSQEMTAAYADYNDTDMQENILFSEQTLRTYLKGDARILGNSGDKLMKRIDEWIAENNLNVGKDLDEIVDKLLKVVPIRAKHGGMCIKGSKLTDACSVDAQTDEFFCACGVCPNICHFYFMINVTYSDFKAAKEIYEYNKKYESKFKRQIQKEYNKIKFLVLNRLQPELLELEREIKLKGENTIKTNHPELIDIIDNINTIKEEIVEWTSPMN